MRADQPKVGRYAVAGFHQHDVAGHDLLCGDSQPPAVAQHGGVRIDHAADRVQCLFGAAFLHEADDGVQDYYRQDDRRVAEMVEQQRDQRGGQQHIDQQVVELQQQAHQRSAPGGCRQAVRA